MKWFFITIIIFFLGFFGILNPFRNSVHYVAAPIQFGLRKLAIDIKGSFSFYRNLKNLRNENLLLLNENENLKASILDLKILKEENLALKDQLKIKENPGFDREFAVASVMGNSQDLKEATILLDKGAKHGIKIGNNVVKSNYMVGIVREVYDTRSLVELTTSPKMSITVENIENFNTEGIATGQYGTSILLKRILPGERLEMHDIFITSGKDGLFLPGFALGEVSTIINNPSEPLKSAYLKTGFDIVSLNKVFVILDK